MYSCIIIIITSLYSQELPTAPHLQYVLPIDEYILLVSLELLNSMLRDD